MADFPDIVVLTSGCHAVRLRPRVFVGDLSAPALHEMILDLARAAVNPAYPTECTRLELRMHVGGALTLHDDGRGQPVELSTSPADRGRSRLEVNLRELFGGGPVRMSSWDTGDADPEVASANLA